jgi:hypothetical protein
MNDRVDILLYSLWMPGAPFRWIVENGVCVQTHGGHCYERYQSSSRTDAGH